MKLIIFDIDGTLTDTKKVDDKCFISAFESVFGIKIKNQNWNELENVTDWGITEEIIQNEYNRLPTGQEYELMINKFVNLLEMEKEYNPLQFKEVAYARDFLYHLKNKTEYKIGIATGGWGKSARFKLENIEIDVDRFAFSNSDKCKSREEITKDVINQLNGNSNNLTDEIIYFGDGEWDFQSCQKLGIGFIGIDINNNGKLKGLGANYVFMNYENKEKIIEIIEKAA